MNDESTLGEAILWLEENKQDGVVCPCCGQFAKIYRRKLTSGMARDLILLYRANGHLGFVKVPRSKNNSDLAKLRFWGLIIPSTRSGYWMITEKGRRFLLDITKVPKYILLYNNTMLDAEEEELTSIRSALGDHFDYDELMGS